MEEVAFVKMMSHAAKHPWANVFGLLLSKGDGSDYSDCLPLFHTPLLASSLEVALLLSSEHCNQTKTRISGAYFCGEDAMLPLVMRTMSQLNAKLSKLQLIVIKQGASKANALQVYTLASGNSWKSTSTLKVGENAWGKLQTTLADEKVVASVTDFDECLDDVTKD